MVQSTLAALQGVIFDLDGTLVDSRLDFREIREAVGCPAGTGVLEFIAGLPADQQAAAHAVVLRHEMAGAQRAQWMPGAESCLERLKANHVPIAILTRNAREVAELTLHRLGGKVECLLGREDAAPKPAPDGLLKIARQWRLPVARLAYVGDFRFDLEAARQAGMTGIYYDPVRSGVHAELADIVIHHFDELLPAGKR